MQEAFLCRRPAPRLQGAGARALRVGNHGGEQRRSNAHVRDGVDEDSFVTLRRSRDAQIALPTLIIPSVPVNICGGHLPEPEDNGIRYLKIPIDKF